MSLDWMGKPIEEVGVEEVRAAARDRPRAVADYGQLPPEARQRLMRKVTQILLAAQDQVDAARHTRDQLAAVVDLAEAARQRGIIEGLRMALAQAPVAAPPPAAKADDEIDGKSPWTDYIEPFFADRPGLTQKTKDSYQSAFDEWQKAAPIARVALRDITPHHLTKFADHLRDRSSGRGEDRKLHRKTIVRTLGHIKTFLGWAVGKRHVADRGFGTVRAREATRQERVERPRRAFTVEEMQRLFDSPLFLLCHKFILLVMR